ncbi:exopolyphosphatase [Microbacterium sp. NPDC055903]
MSEHNSLTAHDDVGVQVVSVGRGFETPEGLRTLLNRLNDAGPGSWRADREAAELMRYAAFRYRRLARKYEMDAWEVASAAFEVMLARSTRAARNPWAVVTRAVQITCKAEIRAAGLLMSTSRVRHTNRIAGFHDAVRFAEREGLDEYHPALATGSAVDEDDEPSDDDKRVTAALSEAVGLFVTAGWDAELAADCVEYAAYRFADLSSRASAIDVLRRDRAVSERLGVPPRSWAALLTTRPGRDLANTRVSCANSCATGPARS